MPDLITIVFPKAEKAPVVLGCISVQLVLEKPTADASNQASCLSASSVAGKNHQKGGQG